MGDPAVRCWLVERDYDDRGLVRLVYATPDGHRAVTRERSPRMLERSGVTAATDVQFDRLDAVDDPDTRERYVAEAARMADRHGPSDRV